jgi:PAS domain S-box-containing protein
VTPAGPRLIQLQRRPSRRHGRARPPGEPHWAWRYATAAGLVLLAVFLNMRTPELTGRHLPFFLFFPAVVLAGLVGGMGPGLLATVMGAAAAATLNFEPFRLGAVHDAMDRVRVLLFILAGGLISWVSHVLHGAVRRMRDAESDAASGRDRLSLITDSMPALVSYIGPGHRYVFGNAVYAQWFGEAGADIRGKHMSEVLGRAAYERIAPHLEEAFAGRSTRYSALVPYRTGERWIEAHYMPDKGRDGAVRGVVALVVDVSERKRAEAARLESERKYRALFESMDEGFCIIQLVFDEAGAASDYRFLEVNPAFARQTGLEHAEGRSMRELAPGHEDYWFEIYGRVALTGEVVRFELPANVLGRWYEVHAWRFGDPAARQVAILFKDVRERRAAQEAIVRGEQQLRTIIDEMNMLISYIGPDQRYVFNNRRYLEWFGRHPEELKGVHLRDLLSPVDYERARPRVESALAGEQVTFDAAVSMKGEKRHVRVEYIPDRGEDGAVRGIFAFVTDVTQTKRRAEELQKAVEARTEELRRTVEELEAFSYTVSHDLRAPLRAIQGYASIIAKRVDGSLGEETQRLVERIGLSATRMDALIQDLLAFGRLSRGDYRMYPLEVEPVVDHILAQYPGFEQAAVAVRRPLGRVIGQDSLLTQVLSNLLGNALKFVPKGRTPRIELRVERRERRARIVVADNGMGLTAEERARLFRPFTRLHSSQEYEGTGIGLAIVKKAAERMGGAVGVESEPGVGSRFWVELPDGEGV